MESSLFLPNFVAPVFNNMQFGRRGNRTQAGNRADEDGAIFMLNDVVKIIVGEAKCHFAV